MRTAKKIRPIPAYNFALSSLFEQAVQNSARPMCIVDKDGKYLWGNPKWVDLLGTFCPISKDYTDQAGTYEEIEIKRGELPKLTLEVCVEDIGEGKRFITARDVGERVAVSQNQVGKHLEIQHLYQELERKNAELVTTQQLLVQSGKMAALGELSAGIAHELNQPLQAVKGYGQELTHILSKWDNALEALEARTYTKEIVQAADKMSAIIQHLRVFTRKSGESMEWVDPHAPISDAFKMLDRQLTQAGIAVEKNYDTRAGKVYANALQLEQVFINLATNARDAIVETKRGFGKITIETHGSKDFVEIKFCDDGAGMSPATQKKIFNPFFTTKEVGKGMGLGMSLSYGMLSKIHGSIVVKSEIGKGTEFSIKIPKDFRTLA